MEGEGGGDIRQIVLDLQKEQCDNNKKDVIEIVMQMQSEIETSDVMTPSSQEVS